MQCVLLWLSLGRLRTLRLDAESSNNLDENGGNQSSQLHTGSTKDERQDRFHIDEGSRQDHSVRLQLGNAMQHSASEVVSDTSGTDKDLPRTAVVALGIPSGAKAKQQLSWKQRLQKRLHRKQNYYLHEQQHPNTTFPVQERVSNSQPVASFVSRRGSHDQVHELAPQNEHIVGHATDSHLANVSHSWEFRAASASATDSPLQTKALHSSHENLTNSKEQIDPLNLQLNATATELGSGTHVSTSLREDATTRNTSASKTRRQARRHDSMQFASQRYAEGKMEAHWWSQMELASYVSNVRTLPWSVLTCLIVFVLAGVAFIIMSRNALASANDLEDGAVGSVNQQAQESTGNALGVTNAKRRNSGTYKSKYTEGSESASGSHNLEDIYRPSPRSARGSTRETEQRKSTGDGTLSDNPKEARAEWLEQYMKIQSALTPTSSQSGGETSSKSLRSWALGDEAPAKGPTVIRITSVAEELEYVPTVRETPSDAPQHKGRGRLTVIRESSEERRASKRSVSPCEGLLSAPGRA